MLGNQNELLFSFWPIQLSASGQVSFLVAISVALLIIAVAWRVIKG